MEIKIKDLKPNPYRDLDNYPINREKIETLKASIEQTGFWDNILARKSNNDIQIAYGHHRLIALRELLKLDSIINIPVKDLPDSVMIQVMANENMDEWKVSPAVIDETVRVAKQFLEKHPEEIKTKNPIHKKSIHNAEDKIYYWSILAYQIAEFLGWGEHKVWDSLDTISAIEKGEVDEEAIKDMPTERHAREFTKAVKRDPVPKQKQKQFAREIKESFENGSKKDHIPSKEIHKKVLQEKWTPEKKDNRKEIERKQKMLEFETFLNDTLFVTRDMIDRLKTIQKIKDDLGESLVIDKMTSVKLTANFEVIHRQLNELLNKH